MEDREETLVNVAFSCKVIKPLILSPQTPDKAADVMKKRISSGELVTSEKIDLLDPSHLRVIIFIFYFACLRVPHTRTCAT